MLIIANINKIYEFMLWSLETYKLYSMSINESAKDANLYYFDKTDIVGLIFWKSSNIVKLYYLKPPEDEGSSSSDDKN